ncbi:MAG: HepT-like ribonuclease domain-containing protein [Candidatus Lokiarchaeia archaeon]
MKRKDQYSRKFEFIVDKISLLPDNIEENIFYIDALFYRLQVSIDAAMDIVAMLCKDLGITVKDDYSNIDELEGLDLFQKKLLRNLRRLNGVRNVLVHRYNKIEEEQIIKEKDNFIIILKEFVKRVEKVANERLQLSE